jgi:hypothetical protein
MNGFFWAVGATTVIMAAIMSYAVTRRYGWGAAVAVPVIALVAMTGMNWQAQGLNFAEGMALIRETLVFTAPVVLGVVIGIGVAWRWRA